MKVHILDKGYVCVPKRRGFTEDPKEEISGNQGFWAKVASYSCDCASRDRDSSYSSSFPP